MATTLVFERVKVQMLFPCRGSCRLCRTFLKNDEFRRLCSTGRTADVNDFYLQVVERYKPDVLAISGGEAILSPGIERFIAQAQVHCSKVNLYTSFQYTTEILEQFDCSAFDADRLTLVHSVIHYLPEMWHCLTDGFPHALYVANLRTARDLPVRKRVMFVLNHLDSAAEVDLFLREIKPDSSFELAYKLINDQNNNFGVEVMRKSRRLIRELLRTYNAPLRPPETGVAAGVASDDVLRMCRYRREPVELRFAFWKERESGVCLKVRFCPYFGPSTHHKYVVGRDDLAKIDQWFCSEMYRRKCGSCRLLHYSDADVSS